MINTSKKTAFEMSPRGKPFILFMSVITSLSLSNLLLSGRSIPENSLQDGRVNSSFLPEGLSDKITGAIPAIGGDPLFAEPVKKTEKKKKKKAGGFGRRKSGTEVAAKFEKEVRAESKKEVQAVSAKATKAKPAKRTYHGKKYLTNKLEGNHTLCFVTSIFARSLKTADRPTSVANLYQNQTTVDFFLFTNLENLPAPGWKKIVKKDLPYRRFITQSRWGKFVGWREEALSHCGTVIYFDGYLRPVKKLSKFQRLAAQVKKSEAGIASVHHPVFNGKSMEHILGRIVENKKDIASNVNATLNWLREQPDFEDKVPYFINKYFGKFSILSLSSSNRHDSLTNVIYLLCLQHMIRPVRGIGRPLVSSGIAIPRRRTLGAISLSGATLFTISI
jgi:hypothetical protein